MGAFAWRETMLGHGLLWGNGYAEIERSNSGRALAMWPLAPDRVQVDRDDAGRVIYRYWSPSGEPTVLPARDVFHLHGPGFDGITGYSVIRLAKESVTLGLAAEAFGGTFFGRGVRPTGVYTHPNTLTSRAYENLKKSIVTDHSGEQILDPFILEEGMKWQSIGIPPDDAQFLETRKFQVTDICRWFRVPPHKIADLEHATFSNIEHQAIEFVTDTIMPRVVRLEHEADRKLFGQLPRQRWTKINVNALLRGDFKTRLEGFQIARLMGLYSINDIREIEDMNPIKGLAGSQYIVPMNMTTAAGIAETAKPKPEPKPQPVLPEPDSQPQPPAGDSKPDDAERALESGRTLQELMMLPIQRKLGREMGDIGKQAKRFMAAGKDRGGFGVWLIKFFDEHSELIAADYVSAATVLAARVGCDPKRMKARFELISREVATEYSNSSADELLDGWDAGRIDEVLAERMQTLPLKLAVAYTDRTVSMIMLGVRENMASGAGVTSNV